MVWYVSASGKRWKASVLLMSQIFSALNIKHESLTQLYWDVGRKHKCSLTSAKKTQAHCMAWQVRDIFFSSLSCPSCVNGTSFVWTLHHTSTLLLLIFVYPDGRSPYISAECSLGKRWNWMIFLTIYLLSVSSVQTSVQGEPDSFASYYFAALWLSVLEMYVKRKIATHSNCRWNVHSFGP